MKVLLLSGYDAVSHRHWRTLLVESLPEYDWTVVALPDRHFYWRSRGNGLSFAFSHRQELSARYDLIVATSMVDLCSVRGFVPSLGQVPALVYFHENQFAYPTRKPTNNLVNAQLTSVYTALAADRLLFNSDYNRVTFFRGAQSLLNMMPDGVEKDLLLPVEKRSSVLAVPIRAIDQELPAAEREMISEDNPVQIVWNHRWEYDKQPDVFFDAMVRLKKTGVDFHLHVMGQSFRQVPECFAAARVELADHIVTWGHQSEERYHQVLRSAHVVVSTALHDFQGLSVLEAIYRGCVPVAPDRVAYPEYVPKALLYKCGDGKQHIEEEANNLFLKLQALLSQQLPEAPVVDEYLIGGLVQGYRDAIEGMCA